MLKRNSCLFSELDSHEIEPELRNLKFLFGIYTFFIISDYIMPQYFGIRIGYDITCTRFANILIVIYFLFSPHLLTHFFQTIYRCYFFIPMMMFMFVTGYTMVLRTDIKAFMQPFFEFLSLCMLVYGIRYVVGYKRAIKWSIGCAYFLSCYGIIEFMYGESIFHKFLATMPNIVENSYRSGKFRIMGPCGHALGYGLLLLLLFAIACIDTEKIEVFLFRRPILLLLILTNVFLTGSRSTLGIVFLEAVLIFLISSVKNKKLSLFYLLAIGVFFLVFMLAVYKTALGKYIMMQLASVIDTVFDTNYAAHFGADTTTLENSEQYRKLLPKIFLLDWLNPLVGRGNYSSFGVYIDGMSIHSVDNFYVSEYIKYAYPGLISYILFIIVNLYVMLKNALEKKSAVAKVCFIACVCYFINLWWVDALQTLKYVYIILGIFYAYFLMERDVQ